MFKSKTVIVLMLFVSSALSSSAFAIDLNRGQRLSCSAIVCAIGIAIPKSHNKCRKVLTDWSIYVATLGPFRSKPKCPRVNEENVVVEEVDMACDSIQDTGLRKQCEDASNTGDGTVDDPRNCSGLPTPAERRECMLECDKRGDFCVNP